MKPQCACAAITERTKQIKDKGWNDLSHANPSLGHLDVNTKCPDNTSFFLSNRLPRCYSVKRADNSPLAEVKFWPFSLPLICFYDRKAVNKRAKRRKGVEEEKIKKRCLFCNKFLIKISCAVVRKAVTGPFFPDQTDTSADFRPWRRMRFCGVCHLF